MFNLIITIIAIILVAAVTGASVYYGGKAFNKSGAVSDKEMVITFLAKDSGISLGFITFIVLEFNLKIAGSSASNLSTMGWINSFSLSVVSSGTLTFEQPANIEAIDKAKVEKQEKREKELASKIADPAKSRYIGVINGKRMYQDLTTSEYFSVE